MNLLGSLLMAILFAAHPLDKPTVEDSGEENSHVLADLLDAWEARSIRIRSVDTQLTIEEDHYSKFLNRQNEWVPRTTRRFDTRNSALIVRGAAVRNELTGWTHDEHLMGITIYDYQRDVGDFIGLRKRQAAGRFKRGLFSHFMSSHEEFRNPQNYVFTYDGKRRSNFWGRNSENHALRIYQRPVQADSATLAYRAVYFESMFDGGIDLDHLIGQPVLLYCRPFDVELGGIDRERCSIRGKAVIRSRPCWILHEESQLLGACQRFFFVDPERDWSVARYVGDAGRHGQLQMDIESDRNSDSEWIPRKWSILRIEAEDRPVQSFAIVSSSDLLINKNEESMIEQPVNPVGTWIINDDVRESTQSVIRADGSVRPVLELETDVSVPYEILMSSDAGQGYFEGQSRHWWGLMRSLLQREVGLACGILLLLSAIFPSFSFRRSASDSDKIPRPS